MRSTSICSRMPPYPPRATDFGKLGPVRSFRTRNSMCPVGFSASHAPCYRPGARDNFGRGCGSGGTSKKLLCFFGFLPRSQCDSVTHNPLVPGSSPGGPTISHRNHHVMALRPGDRSPLVRSIGGLSRAWFKSTRSQHFCSMTYATDPVPDFCWKCRVSATGEVILTPRISLFSCDSFTKTPEPLLVQTAFTKSVIE